MKNQNKNPSLILFKASFLLVFLLTEFFGLGLNTVLAQQCKVTINFDANPKAANFNRAVTLSGSVSLQGSVLNPPGTPNAGYCTDPNSLPVKSLAVLISPAGIVGTITLTINQNSVGPVSFSANFVPSDHNYKSGDSISIQASVNYTGGTRGYSPATQSSPVIVQLQQGIYSTYGCQRTNGTFACSPGNYSDCSDAPDCKGLKCQQLSDSNICRAVYACDAGGKYACSAAVDPAKDSQCDATTGCTNDSRAHCSLIPLSQCGAVVGSPAIPKNNSCNVDSDCSSAGNSSSGYLCIGGQCVVDNKLPLGSKCKADPQFEDCDASKGLTCDATKNLCCDSSGNCSSAAGGGAGAGAGGGANNNPADKLYNPLPEEELTHAFLVVVQGFLGIVGIWAVMFIIIGGFQMVIASGNEEMYTKAKKTIIWAVLGLVAALLSFSIIAIVQDLLKVNVAPAPTSATTFKQVASK